MNDQVPLYDAFGEEYDVMVDWDERLKNETPFLRAQLERVGARRLLDVGSATGRHAVHLASLGYEVVGADPSAVMVRRAEANARGAAGVRFVRAGFGGLRAATEGAFDAALCLGNTLPHVRSQADLLGSLRDIAAVLRPGGLLVVQLLNYDRILAEGRRFLGLTQGAAAGREYLFFRFYDYHEGGLTFNVAILQRAGPGSWGWRVESTRLQPVLSSQLEESLAATGFGSVHLYGSYGGEAYRALTANDLIVVAERASGA